MSIKSFFAAVPGSLKGHVNGEELFRSLATSGILGSLASLAVQAIGSVVDHAGAIFPNPTYASYAVVLGTFVLDLLRRQSHGVTPPDVPEAK